MKTAKELTERFRRVKDAYDTLVAGGNWPTQDRVLALLHARHGQAVSLRDLVPIVRGLNAQRVSAASVAKVVKAYAMLDVVQREAAMDMMRGLDHVRGDQRDAEELLRDRVTEMVRGAAMRDSDQRGREGGPPPVGNMQEAEGGEA